MDQDQKIQQEYWHFKIRTPKSPFVQYEPKVNSVQFVHPYEHINHMENNNDTNKFVNVYKKNKLEKKTKNKKKY